MINKELFYTPQGYSYIKCTPQECFNWGGSCICDMCDTYMAPDNIYLIFVLHSAICQDCFDEWIKRTKRYDDDIELQTKNDILFYRSYGFNVIPSNQGGAQ